MRLVKRDGRDGGAVAVTVALLLTVFVGFSALVVDMGYFYTIKRQAQAAADAAALAGCQELILGQDHDAILAVAQEYAEERNSVLPADDITMIMSEPDTEVRPTYVKVTVEQPAGFFFGRFFGHENGIIRAQARADIAYVTGLKRLLPWGLPVLRTTKVTVNVRGQQPVNLLYNESRDRWEGSLQVPRTVSTSGYLVDVRAHNSQTTYPGGVSHQYTPDGVPVELLGASAVTVYDDTSRVRRVSLSPAYVEQGQSQRPRIEVVADTEPTVTVAKGGPGQSDKSYAMTLVNATTNLWAVSVDIPSVPGDSTVSLHPIKVEVGTGNDKYTLSDAAILVVRRATYPILDVEVVPGSIDTSSTGSVTVSVKINDYEYGVSYPLKVVGGGGELGNFMALDFTQVKHPDNYRQQDPSEYPVTGNPYIEFIETGFPHSVHVGDTIWTNTGTGSGPGVESALNIRFAGDDVSFAQWEAQWNLTGERPPTRRIVYVPVLELLPKHANQDVAGTSPMRVVSFAAFYVEPASVSGVDYKNNAIRGTFIEYLVPSDDISDTPPDTGVYVMTPRLVSTGIY
ncbi:MAG: hypothetical protein K0B85_06100 [Coriobacteriia bacterium]|nr:hypothetical protein [Coriobacteriia bacterium]